ncbi:hypothetical protein Catovirus_1_333 [Catovirus CTV1]|uniref:Uncharacterized protein n=1 Tax=Catovirus CTV1 TaxID=1977631 RepID=A0A1V0S999_9VIRU|nr:hypothetical protein Catovirus_1_333 [Catovirus CTV1]
MNFFNDMNISLNDNIKKIQNKSFCFNSLNLDQCDEIPSYGSFTYNPNDLEIQKSNIRSFRPTQIIDKDHENLTRLLEYELANRNFYINKVTSNFYSDQNKMKIMKTTNTLLNEGIKFIEDNNIKELKKLSTEHFKEKDSNNFT